MSVAIVRAKPEREKQEKPARASASHPRFPPRRAVSI